jgi:hypothetical protein
MGDPQEKALTDSPGPLMMGIDPSSTDDRAELFRNMFYRHQAAMILNMFVFLYPIPASVWTRKSWNGFLIPFLQP